MPITPGLVARHTPSGPGGRPAALIDIAQDLLLGHLVEASIFDLLVFKGGTALRKTFAGAAGRFSTDLDFSLRRPDADRATAAELLAETIDGYAADPFEFTVNEHRGRYEIRYETHLGDISNLKTKLDVGPPVWLEPTRRAFVPLPVHRAYDLPESIPVMALEENIAEKIARLNRRTPARDMYDLVWVATHSPHSRFDRALVRRLSILKCWVDTHDLHTNGNSWQGPPEPAPLNPTAWLRERREFDDESLGLLASPAPDLDVLASDLRHQYAFLADLDTNDQEALSADGSRRDIAIRHIQQLPGGTLADTVLW